MKTILIVKTFIHSCQVLKNDIKRRKIRWREDMDEKDCYIVDEDDEQPPVWIGERS